MIRTERSRAIRNLKFILWGDVTISEGVELFDRAYNQLNSIAGYLFTAQDLNALNAIPFLSATLQRDDWDVTKHTHQLDRIIADLEVAEAAYEEEEL